MTIQPEVFKMGVMLDSFKELTVPPKYSGGEGKKTEVPCPVTSILLHGFIESLQHCEASELRVFAILRRKVL